MAVGGFLASSLALLGLREPGACPPQSWVLEDFGTGHWILERTEESWGWYLDFLNVSRSHWDEEFHCSDVHQFAFTEDGYVMNHSIPKRGFNLLYHARTNDRWETSPYPTGRSPTGALLNLTQWRNALDKGPLGESCVALRTDMPVMRRDEATGLMHEHKVTFWRELVSPRRMKVTLIVTTLLGNEIEPWRSQGFSQRYFWKAVQSFGDAALRLPCAASGVVAGTDFC